MKYLLNLFKTPALIFHELCHIVFAWLTLSKVEEITIHKSDTFKKDFSYSVEVVIIAKKKILNSIVSLAPFFGTVILLFTSVIVFDNLYVLIYTVLCFKIFVPSEEDINSMVDYKTEKELLLETLKEEGIDIDPDVEIEIF